MTAAEFAAGLREVAAFYEENPEMPVPGSGHDFYTFAASREQFLGFSRRYYGAAEKSSDDTHYLALLKFSAGLSIKCFMAKMVETTTKVPSLTPAEAAEFTEAQP